MATNRAIGLDGRMPWHLPGELKHFKEATMGKPIVMGRKTWESIGRALPGRQNIIVTRNQSFSAEGCDVAASLEEALEIACGDEVMIIGGGQLYQQALPMACRILLTVVELEPEADTWFPDWDQSSWQVIHSREVSGDEVNLHTYQVLEWVRRPMPASNRAQR